jgi:hypothetical protein
MEDGVMEDGVRGDGVRGESVMLNEVWERRCAPLP